MSATDDLLRNYRAHRPANGGAALPAPPRLRLAVVACMDARLNAYGVLGLEEGDAHVIRNAGGVVTDDVIRSLTISQRMLGTTEIVLIHHTDCGMLTLDDCTLKDQIEAETGIRPPFAFEAFPDLEADVRQSVNRIKASPFVPHKDDIRGFVFDLSTGDLREIAHREPN